MQEEQRSVYLVGIEQRAVVDKEFRILPRITVGCRYFTVRIAPVAFAPVTGVVADTGMGNSSRKQVGLCLEILRHETTV